MAAPRQGLPVRLERAPHRGAAFALSNASKRARTRSIGSRSRGSLFIFRSSPAVAPPIRSRSLAWGGLGQEGRRGLRGGSNEPDEPSPAARRRRGPWGGSLHKTP